MKPDFRSGFFMQNDLNWKVCRSIKSLHNQIYPQSLSLRRSLNIISNILDSYGMDKDTVNILYKS
jgi:hypothetical protein